MSVCPACLPSLSLGQDVDAENICTLTAGAQLAGCKEGCTREERLKGPSWRLGRQAGVPSRHRSVGYTYCGCALAAGASIFVVPVGLQEALVSEQIICATLNLGLSLNNSSNSPHTIHITQAAAFSTPNLLKLSVICSRTSYLHYIAWGVQHVGGLVQMQLACCTEHLDDALALAGGPAATRRSLLTVKGASVAGALFVQQVLGS